MADTIDIQNTNEWLAEVQAAARELVNVLKAGVDVGVSGELGDAALADTLDQIAVGDAAAVRESLALDGYTHYLSLPNSDLNEVLAQGTYAVNNGDNAKNTPNRFSAGVLYVEYSGGQYVQMMLSRGEAMVAIRGSSNGRSWSRWKDFLLGGVSYTTGNDPFWGNQRTSINEYNSNSSTQTNPLWKSIPFGWAQMIALGRTDNRAAYLAATSFGSRPRLAVGILNSEVVGDGTGSDIPDNAYVWAEVWTKSNTTVDSNGQIKLASPIFRLANTSADVATDGFEVGGAGAFNAEARGVTATHDDTGVYTVSGSLGFATEGWYIENPTDANKRIKVFVEYDQDNDGTIHVRTYKPDYSKGHVDKGEPVDIPDGRYITLRLEMPPREEPDESETPQPSTSPAAQESAQ